MRRTDGAGESPDHVELLLFDVGGRTFGLETGKIRQTSEVDGESTRVPGAPAAVEGVLDVRGEVTVVVDARALLDDGRFRPGLLPPGVAGDLVVDADEPLLTDRLVVFDREGDECGLRVGDLRGVEVVSIADVDVIDGPIGGGGPDADLLSAVVHDDDRPVYVLDPAAIAAAATAGGGETGP